MRVAGSPLTPTGFDERARFGKTRYAPRRASSLEPLEPTRLDDPLEELLRPRLARRREDLLGRPLFQDHPRVEEADAVRDLAREAHLMGRDHHRHPGRSE